MTLDKVKKIIVVIFLTLLIWVWAYSSQEESIEETGLINIAPSAGGELFVSFVNFGSSVPLKMVLKGPAAKVAELRRKIHTRQGDYQSLEFFYNPAAGDNPEPGIHNLDVLQFLKMSPRIEKLGLAVESCQPQTLKVKVVKLEQKWLTVRCIDENGNIIRHESIEPSRVKMYVPPDWTGEALRAFVELTEQQIERARKAPIVARPFVQLSAEVDRRRFAEPSVKIKLPGSETLADHVIQPRIGFIFSKNLQGKYKVQLINQSDLTSATNLKATEEAFSVYNNMRYQLLIEIRDGDETASGEVAREVIYNFPAEYVRKNEIQLSQPPRQAIFKLKPVAATEPVQ
jgi:hypothetical protein